MDSVCFLLLVSVIVLNILTAKSANIYRESNAQTLDATSKGATLNNGTIYVSKPITFRSGVPVGQKLFYTAYVLSNGVIYFNDDNDVKLPGSPDLYLAHSLNKYILAPFWADILPNKGRISYSLYEHDCPNVASMVSEINKIYDKAKVDVTSYYSLADFDVDSVLVATWSQVEPFSNFSHNGNVEKNTFQAVFISGWIKQSAGKISDEKTSYVIYIYQQNMMTWTYVPGRVVNIGLAARDASYLPNIETSYVTMLDQVNGNKGETGISTFLVGQVNTQEEKCQRFLCKNKNLLSNERYRNETQQLFQCPCTLDRMGFHWEPYQKRGLPADFRCYIIRQVAKTKLLNGNNLNKLCCYKSLNENSEGQKDAAYIRSRPYTGHVLVGNPTKDSDAADIIVAHDTCCENTPKHMCDQFYEIFPDSECTNHVNFANAYGLGDTHIITFDGWHYIMYGWGEFTLMNIRHWNFVLQGRTERAHHVDGSQANGTVFTALAAKEDVNDFQVELASNKKWMNIWINGVNKTEDFYRDSNYLSYSENLCVSRETKDNKNFVTATFSSGLSITVNVGIQNLELKVQVGEHLNKAITGLLGYYNEDPSDDLRYPDNTRTPGQQEPLKYSVVKEWTVKSTDTVFYYYNGDNFNQHRHTTYVPIYSDRISSSQLNVSFCQNDSLCQYDYFVTQDRNMAENTRRLSSFYKEERKSLGNHPPTLQISNLDTNALWAVNQSQSSTLNVHISDQDNQIVKLELVGNTEGSEVKITGTTIVYTPDVNKPIVLGIRAVDAEGASSAITYINIGVCSGCNNHGHCTNITKDLENVNDLFWKLKCVCDPSYTGTDCEQTQSVCDINPCSIGQQCTNVNLQHSEDYSCGPCPSGYEYIWGKCVDIDECLTTQKVCGQYSCVNTMGFYTCNCTSGFKFDLGTKNCIDINECDYRPSLCKQTCNNTNGSYKCGCLPGYTLQPDGSTCRLETQYASMCNHCEQICKINSPSATCSCNDGYTVDSTDPHRCKDIDECLTGSHKCNQNCTNQDGYYTCSCNEGYILGADYQTCEACPSPFYGKNCAQKCECNGRGSCNSTTGCVCNEHWSGPHCTQDVDECSKYNPCQRGQICNNTIGSFECSCPVGLMMKAGVCIDCPENYYGQACAHRCSCLSHQKCDKVTGACSCNDGWTNTDCNTDVDECTSGTHNCSTSAHELCFNTQGGYLCTCNVGFGLTDISGKKICRECSEGLFGQNCSSTCNCNTFKTNYCDKTNGTCVCKPGWTGANCDTDIDECSRNISNCSIHNNEVCVNTPGSFNCSCRAGFVHDTDGKTCKDIDFCAGNACTWGCQEINGNTSSECICDLGYHLDTDGLSCIECVEGLFGEKCSELCTCNQDNTQECIKTNGTCVCKPGWTGTTCDQDIDECSDSKFNCSADHYVCLNTQGSFRCTCEQGFKFDTDGKTCIDCPEGQFGLNCQNQCSCQKSNTQSCNKTTGACVCLPGWTGTDCDIDIDECNNAILNNCSTGRHQECVNTPGSFTCRCQQGLELDTDGRTCIDIDHCAKANCSWQCVEVNGNTSSLCLCDVGYSLETDGVTCAVCAKGQNCNQTCDCEFSNIDICEPKTKTCKCMSGWTGDRCDKDINECDNSSYNCNQSQNKVCTNTPGSFQCSCQAGYTMVNDVCTDIDECSTKSDTCSQLCTNQVGYYTCSCNEGYILGADNRTCEACSSPFYGKDCAQKCDCNGHGFCNSTTGCVCNEHWSGLNCTQDVNECLQPNACPSGQLCNNTNGSYVCTCPVGFMMKDGHCIACSSPFYGKDCAQKCDCNGHGICNSTTGCVCNEHWSGLNCTQDVDECSKSNPCPSGQLCNNTSGSYECSCPVGFTMKAGDCIDQKYMADCKQCEQTCKVNNSIVLCGCTDNYTVDNTDPHKCKDIDECLTKTHKCSQLCTNQVGYYTCSCNEGYKLGADNRTCKDIDECLTKTHNCSQICANKDGYYTCSCNEGYILGADNLACEACSSPFYGKDCAQKCDCNGHGICNSTTGCVCNDNWYGLNCTEDVDECSKSNPCPSGQLCNNTIGSYECSCPVGFTMKAGDCIAIPITSVKVTLTFQYEGDFDFKDETRIKSDIRNEVLARLKAINHDVDSINVIAIRKGSIIADTNITLKTTNNDKKSSLDNLAQALYQVETSDEPITINSKSTRFTEATIENLTVNKETSPCTIKTNFDPCLESQSCQEQAGEATCVPFAKKDHVNFIIGMTVGLFGFVLVCAVIAILVNFHVKKNKKLAKKHQSQELPLQKRKSKQEDKRQEKTKRSSVKQEQPMERSRPGQEPKRTEPRHATSPTGYKLQEYSVIAPKPSGIKDLSAPNRQDSTLDNYPAKTNEYNRLNHNRNNHRDSMWQTSDDRRPSTMIYQPSGVQKYGDFNDRAYTTDMRRSSTMITQSNAAQKYGDFNERALTEDLRRGSVMRPTSAYRNVVANDSAYASDRRQSNGMMLERNAPRSIVDHNDRGYTSDNGWQAGANRRNRLESLVPEQTDWNNFQLANTRTAEPQNGVNKASSNDPQRRYSRDPYLLY